MSLLVLQSMRVYLCCAIVVSHALVYLLHFHLVWLVLLPRRGLASAAQVQFPQPTSLQHNKILAAKQSAHAPLCHHTVCAVLCDAVPGVTGHWSLHPSPPGLWSHPASG